MGNFIEETFRRWFIFGENKESGLVDVYDGWCDVITGVSKHEAEKIIDERDKIVNIIIFLIEEDFEKYYKAVDIYKGEKQLENNMKPKKPKY